MPTIGEFLKKQIIARELLQRNVAAQLGLDPRTFRVRLMRDQFSQREIEHLIRILRLDCTAESLLRDYTFDGGAFMVEVPRRGRTRPEENDVWGAIAAVDNAAKRDEVRAREMLALSEQVVRSMTKLGLHVVCTQTATPIEMEETAQGVGWRQAVLQAVRQGATFVYIRPTPAKIKAFNKAWMFQRTIPMDEAVREYTAFREWLTERLVTEKYDTAAAEKLIDSRLAQIYVNDFPYFAPGFSVALIHETDDYHRTKERISVRAPGMAAFAWLDHELHVFRFVSASRKVIGDNIAPGAKKANSPLWNPKVGGVCRRAFRLLNEHFGLGWKDDNEEDGKLG